MEQLLAKLSNLSYELLGIILPGAITLILFVLWLIGAGDLIPLLSHSFFPRLTLTSASATLESVGVRTGFGILGPAIVIAYFLGHLLNWISRSGKQDDSTVKSHLKRTWQSLIFSVPKHTDSFNPKLQPLLDLILPKFSLPAGSGWRQFYPVAKNYLARSSNNSLVGLYQNKYTLHRSLTAGAALVFWLALLSAIVGGCTGYALSVQPRWWALSFLAIGCVILTWGFSDSYAYNWEMFGNSIITETFSLLNSPSNEKS